MLTRAQSLVSAVEDLDNFEPGSWFGEVHVGRGRFHEVWITAVELPGRLYWSSDCSCDREQCVHAAATLLAALARTAPAAPAPPTMRPQVLDWAHQQRLQVAGPPVPAKPPATKAPEALFYALHMPASQGLMLRLYKCRLDKQGQPTGKSQPWTLNDTALLNPPRFVAESDLPALRLLRPLVGPHYGPGWTQGLAVNAQALPQLLQALLETGRAGWDSSEGLVSALVAGDPVHRMVRLRRGPAWPAPLSWSADAATGLQRAGLAVPPRCVVLPADPPWFIDPDTGEAGELEVQGLPPAMAAGLLNMPPLSPAEAAVVASTLADVAPGAARPAVPQPLPRVEVPLAPVLRLSTTQVLPAPWGGKSLRGYKPAGYADMDNKPEPMSHARLSWRYGPVEIEVASEAEQRDHFRDDTGQWVELRRDLAAERAARAEFETQGFRPAPSRESFRGGKPPPEGSFILQNEAAWAAFMAGAVPAWQAQGWQVHWDRHFAHGRLRAQGVFSRLQALPPHPAGDEEGGAAAWSLELGVQVQGQRLPLPPMLADLLKREPRWLDAAQVAAIDDTELVLLNGPDNLAIEIEAGRLKPIVRTLVDLFDSPGAGGELRLSTWDALRLAELQRDPHWAFQSDAALEALAARLRASQGVQPVAPPAGLQIELRPYQRLGLAWLQYLREHDLAGILADDMGLGKTAQTLAHVLAEKQAGRLTRPALAVLPTSLVFNWQAEARSIAPDLRVLVLHGRERAERFAAIPQHDLVLTTYPLLWRDIDALKAHEFHLLVLDEAQAVKNVSSRGAEAVRLLRARHRLCLTGTPLENHLGELWAQFDFLLPGLLGSARDFVRRWRTPIEKQGQTLRAEALAARIRPFVLRRRKEDVAKELPPKTEVIRRVSLEGAQRDLYETVRAAMDEQVRREIAAKGLARSHIMVLDALLKLRQVCCDPHLLKKRTLPKDIERAKLDALSEMLQELVREGRRVLVFSQFAEMLGLVGERLEADGLAYVSLTGRTRDRQAVVQKFQSGLVPVFLVSLKAGGVGLNLTAADTVIHFDPWWNPAAEAQATDRAHRIGQDKPVFVYKLVAAGSIEERILALQQRKAGLAEAVLGEDGERALKFGQEDIEALLAPLE
ncbi:MAG TPA: DEAD/DEAH box helicase [Burkholderiaceae bacterium]|nr:DEAD/DEAH box helicase [Burkholderiaceae bacterium]